MCETPNDIRMHLLCMRNFCSMNFSSLVYILTPQQIREHGYCTLSNTATVHYPTRPLYITQHGYCTLPNTATVHYPTRLIVFIGAINFLSERFKWNALRNVEISSPVASKTHRENIPCRKVHVQIKVTCYVIVHACYSVTLLLNKYCLFH